MPLSHMEHFLLQTEDIEATKDWYVKVLGLRVGPCPDFKFTASTFERARN